MRTIIKKSAAAVMFLAVLLLLQGCLKDKATATYRLYKPVLKPKNEARASIGTVAATPIINPGKLFLLGNYIYLNEVDKGIHIIDNTNPAAPVNKYFLNIPGNLDLAVKGNTLYADFFQDLVAIDISNPAHATVSKFQYNAFPRRYYPNYFLNDTSKVIVDWIVKDTIVPVDWPGSPSYLAYNTTTQQNAPAPTYSNAPGVTTGISGSMARFTLLGQYLYTVSNSNLSAYNVSQPANPKLASDVNLGWGIETIFPFQNKLFIGSQSGVYIFDVSSPAQPMAVSEFQHVTSCDPVIADGDFAYVTLRSGTFCNSLANRLDILDISNISSPLMLKSYAFTNPHGLSKDGNLLFICDGDAGLKVLDATDPFNLELLHNETGINAYDVITTGKRAIVVSSSGLHQFSYDAAGHMQRLSSLSYQSK